MFLFNNYNDTLKAMFGERVQKISIDAGFTCPNRDGIKGRGGCTYCNNQSFSPNYSAVKKTPAEQMREGMYFFRKYEAQKYLAYFQSYTNTYADLETLRSLYEPVLQMPSVIGLVVGTRPDCVDESLLDYFQNLAKKYYVMIEYGVESTNNDILQKINRGHTYEESVQAIRATSARDIPVGVHMILGLPDENRGAILAHADKLSKLPITMLKLHQLQIIRGTKMAQEYVMERDKFKMFALDEYIDLVIDFIERVNPKTGFERFVSQSPKTYLVAPDWGIKNFEFTAKLQKRMVERGAYQGRLWHVSGGDSKVQ